MEDKDFKEIIVCLNIIEVAQELLRPLEKRFYNQISDVYWIQTENGMHDIADYCCDCIDDAVKEERKDYLLKQRKLNINDRDFPFEKFIGQYNYGGGYESDSFLYCSNCGRSLDTIILPNEEVFELLSDELESISDGIISDRLAYELYGFLYNGNIGSSRDMAYKLAKRVIEIFRLNEIMDNEYAMGFKLEKHTKPIML